MKYHIYSDYSCNRDYTVAAFAFCVITCDGGRIGLHSHGVKLLKKPLNVTVGEVVGMLAGVKKVPDRCKASAHIDVDHIDLLLDEKSNAKGAKQLKNQHQIIKKHKRRLESLEISYYDKGKRNGFYRWCHAAARSRATFSKRPINLNECSSEDLFRLFIPRPSNNRSAWVYQLSYIFYGSANGVSTIKTKEDDFF